MFKQYQLSFTMTPQYLFHSNLFKKKKKNKKKKKKNIVAWDKYLHMSESFSFNIGEKHLLKDYFYFWEIKKKIL